MGVQYHVRLLPTHADKTKPSEFFCDENDDYTYTFANGVHMALVFRTTDRLLDVLAQARLLSLEKLSWMGTVLRMSLSTRRNHSRANRV